MLQKAMIALAAATLSSVVPQAASAEYYCYGDGAPGSARCAGIGLGLYSPRWYYSDNYPYYIYFYSGNPYSAPGEYVGSCYPIRRPVLTPAGWRTRTVQLCD
jgi:hypothetical protein